MMAAIRRLLDGTERAIEPTVRNCPKRRLPTLLEDWHAANNNLLSFVALIGFLHIFKELIERHPAFAHRVIVAPPLVKLLSLLQRFECMIQRGARGQWRSSKFQNVNHA